MLFHTAGPGLLGDSLLTGVYGRLLGSVALGKPVLAICVLLSCTVTMATAVLLRPVVAYRRLATMFAGTLRYRCSVLRQGGDQR